MNAHNAWSQTFAAVESPNQKETAKLLPCHFFHVVAKHTPSAKPADSSLDSATCLSDPICGAELCTVHAPWEVKLTSFAGTVLCAGAEFPLGAARGSFARACPHESQASSLQLLPPEAAPSAAAPSVSSGS